VAELAGEYAALGEASVFPNHFKDLPDPRRPGKVLCLLEEVLLLCLLAVLAGAETFVDIASFGEKKLELLRRFLSFRHGVPRRMNLSPDSLAMSANLSSGRAFEFGRGTNY
jgi:DDE_Tnp_1-associated